MQVERCALEPPELARRRFRFGHLEHVPDPYQTLVHFDREDHHEVGVVILLEFGPLRLPCSILDCKGVKGELLLDQRQFLGRRSHQVQPHARIA